MFIGGSKTRKDGSVWESNPLGALFKPPTGFEDQGPHQRCKHSQGRMPSLVLQVFRGFPDGSCELFERRRRKTGRSGRLPSSSLAETIAADSAQATMATV